MRSAVFPVMDLPARLMRPFPSSLGEETSATPTTCYLAAPSKHLANPRQEVVHDERIACEVVVAATPIVCL